MVQASLNDGGEIKNKDSVMSDLSKRDEPWIVAVMLDVETSSARKPETKRTARKM